MTNHRSTSSTPAAPVTSQADLLVNLHAAVGVFTASPGSDADVLALQAAYRPLTNRTAALLALAMAGTLTGPVSTALSNLPTAASSRVTVRLSDDSLAAIRRRWQAAVSAAATVAAQSTDDSLTAAALADIVSRTTAAIASFPMGSGRKTQRPSITDMLAAGLVAAGDTLTHGSHTASINADGTLTINGASHSFNDAGKLASGNKGENGYRYWSTAAGVKLAAVRDAHWPIATGDDSSDADDSPADGSQPATV